MDFGGEASSIFYSSELRCSTILSDSFECENKNRMYLERFENLDPASFESPEGNTLIQCAPFSTIIDSNIVGMPHFVAV